MKHGKSFQEAFGFDFAEMERVTKTALDDFSKRFLSDDDTNSYMVFIYFENQHWFAEVTNVPNEQQLALYEVEPLGSKGFDLMFVKSAMPAKRVGTHEEESE